MEYDWSASSSFRSIVARGEAIRAGFLERTAGFSKSTTGAIGESRDGFRPMRSRLGVPVRNTVFEAPCADNLLIDDQGHVRRAYCADANALFLIRPDGHIGTIRGSKKSD